MDVFSMWLCLEYVLGTFCQQLRRRKHNFGLLVILLCWSECGCRVHPTLHIVILGEYMIIYVNLCLILVVLALV